jgi:carbamoyl-phosphate synthase large subunit
MINILILSAGRRVELIRCFERAALRLNIESQIIAAEITKLAPANYIADKFILLPAIEEPNYISSLIQLIGQEHISLVIPTIDTELLILSKNKEYIEKNTSAKVLVSDFRVVSVCRDKNVTGNFLFENGFLTPKIISDEEISQKKVQFPLFLKPVDGSSSNNTFKINNYEELTFFRKYVKKSMVQEFITGDEYTIDVFCDFEGNIISITPRLRIATRCGEISKGKIVKDRTIISEITKLVAVLHPIGQITIQCMKTNRGVEFIEINPRFGGGAPMSIMAGADSCEYLYRLLSGETLKFRDEVREGLYFLRFDDAICLDEDMRLLS